MTEILKNSCGISERYGKLIASSINGVVFTKGTNRRNSKITYLQSGKNSLLKYFL